jgi:tRNA (mo5U34)-methyltransferase
MSTAELQDRINAITWYHEFDFGNGLVARDRTPNAVTHRRLWQFIQGELDQLNLSDKSVLDIGCWDGFWSFYAERRGAKVFATDDATQNWTGENGFKLAHELLGSKVEYDLSRSIYDLAALGRRFDVIFFLGVYYHLLDPIYALAQLRHCCHDSTTVIVEGDVSVGWIPDGIVYRGDLGTGPRFVPGLNALTSMLRLAYFDIERDAMLDHYELIGERMPRKPVARVNRALRVCRPVVVKNDYHWYRPPFGLAQYDLRWR